MQTAPVKILAASRRQAMDWGLVLASQGIEAIIDHSSEDSTWQLWVPEPDYENAREALRQYQVENRGWPWQQAVPGTGLRFDWSSLAWVALLILFYGLNA